MASRLTSDPSDATTREQLDEWIGLDGEVDAAILDQLMPGRLGTDVIHRWRAAGVDIPVLMLTAVDDDDLIARVLEFGAVDYVRKPFNLAVLKARLSILL